MHDQTKLQRSRLSKEGSGPGDTISARLRQYYDSVKEEAIPDRFLDLLERLDEADRAFSGNKSVESGTVNE